MVIFVRRTTLRDPSEEPLTLAVRGRVYAAGPARWAQSKLGQ
jgi:hypothetical protein